MNLECNVLAFCLQCTDPSCAGSVQRVTVDNMTQPHEFVMNGGAPSASVKITNLGLSGNSVEVRN